MLTIKLILKRQLEVQQTGSESCQIVCRLWYS